jgi:hypothetical protein
MRTNRRLVNAHQSERIHVIPEYSVLLFNGTSDNNEQVRVRQPGGLVESLLEPGSSILAPLTAHVLDDYVQP